MRRRASEYLTRDLAVFAATLVLICVGCAGMIAFMRALLARQIGL